MTRLSGWTVAGVLAAMLIGVVHAAASPLLERRHYTRRLFPRDWW
jgi:hypothetical protein